MKQLVQTIGEDNVDTKVRNLNLEVGHELQPKHVSRQKANKEISNDNNNEHESNKEMDPEVDEASSNDTFPQ